MCLHLMVKSGFILRLAWGVFVRQDETNETFSVEQIAKTKADAFGKQLLNHGNDVAVKLGISDQANEMPTFYTNGSTSYFHINGTKIKMQKIAPRKGVCIGENKVGGAIRALWNIGEKLIEPEHIDGAVSKFTRSERGWLSECIRWMPEWLSTRCLSTSRKARALMMVLPAPIRAPSLVPLPEIFYLPIRVSMPNDITPNH
jgi:hypothetical protein